MNITPTPRVPGVLTQMNWIRALFGRGWPAGAVCVIRLFQILLLRKEVFNIKITEWLAMPEIELIAMMPIKLVAFLPQDILGWVCIVFFGSLPFFCLYYLFNSNRLLRPSWAEGLAWYLMLMPGVFLAGIQGIN